MLTQLKADFPDDLRVVYRHFPLISIHDKATLAAVASESAGRMGKFWEMHDLIYIRQAEWAPFSVEGFTTWLGTQAEALELDAGQFAADLQDQDIFDHVMEDFQAAAQAGIPGTPFLLINGRIYSGPTDYFNLSVIVKLYALQNRQYRTCPPMVIDPAREYEATLVTEKGDVVIGLLPESAPLAVNNFVFLAREGFFDGVTFHRVFPGYIAQAGDPSGTGFGGPGYAFVREDGGLTYDEAGMVAMDSVSNGSQFFITLAPLPSLEGSYTIFGRVIEGFDVLASLAARDPSSGLNLPPGDVITRILIEER